MLIVKGVSRKSGSYEGQPYDNFYIHCLNDSPSKPTIAGDACEILKVKAYRLHEVLGGLVKSDADWRALVDCKIRAFYDRYGNAEQITLVED